MGDQPTDWMWVLPADTLQIPGIEGAVEIGRGASGVVYRAHQPEFNRDVAVKVLDPTATGPDGWQRFQRELRAMGPLSSHPGIVAVHSAGITPAGRPFIVMEHVSGGALSRLVEPTRPMPPGRVLDIGIRLAGALAAAHHLGILHRDVKPANVLITAYGDVKLADFGISRIPGGMETSAGLLFVSVNYAAPELLQGAPPSPASDIYALGATLFTLLAGHPPFEHPGEPPDQGRTLRRVSAAPVPDLRPSGVPEVVCGVVERTLAKDPRLRPQSAEELAAELRAAAAAIGAPLPAPAAARLGRLPLAMGAVAAVLVVAAVLTVLLVGRGGGGGSVPPPATASATPPSAAQLRRGLVTVQDLPGGYQDTGQEPLGVNSLIVCANPFPPTGLLTQVGVQLGVPGGRGPFVESNLASFKAGMAEALLTQFGAQTRACPSFRYVVNGASTGVQVSLRDGATVGDQTLRLHIVEDNGVTTDSVCARVGDVITIVEVDNLTGGDTALADRLAGTSVDRLRTALSGG